METSNIRTIAAEPFSGEIEFHKYLQIDGRKDVVSCNYLKRSIIDRIKALKLSPPINPDLNSELSFPTVLDFARFSYLVYSEDVSHIEDTLQTKLKGWELICFVTSSKNLYRGGLFFHKKYNHVVLAHRGTTAAKQWFTSNVRVVKSKYAAEVSPAATFAHITFEALNEIISTIQKFQKIHFEFFFTGHSLGAYIAQITTMTSKYLLLKDEKFILNEQRKYFHVHCFSFEDPGCKFLLLETAKDKCFRYPNPEYAVNLDTLDIRNYLMEPNMINKANLHAGALFLIPGNSNEHGIKYIIIELEKCNDNEIKIIRDWPRLTNERSLFEYFSRDYKAEESHLLKCLANVFTFSHQQFLRVFEKLREIDGYEKLVKNECVLEQLQQYRITEHTIELYKGSLRNFIPLVGLFLKCSPNIDDDLINYLSKADKRKIFYQKQSMTFEKSVVVKFKTENWKTNQNPPVQLFKTNSTRLKLIELYQCIQAEGEYKEFHTILDLEKLLMINKSARLIPFLLSENKHLFIVECNDKIESNDKETVKLFNEIKQFLNQKKDTVKIEVKIIFVILNKDDSNIRFLTNLFGIDPKPDSSLKDRLTHENRNYFLDQTIKFNRKGQNATLRDLLNDNYDNILDDILDDSEIIDTLSGGADVKIGMFEAYFNTFEACRQQIISPIPNSVAENLKLKDFDTDQFLVVNGKELRRVDEEKLDQSSNDASQTFRQLCCDYPRETFYWIGAARDSVAYFQEFYCPELYIKRRFTGVGESRYSNNLSVDEKDFWKSEEVEIVIDEPGMGKSTTLTNLCVYTDSPWILRMNLRECTDALVSLPRNGIDMTDVVKFLSTSSTIDLAIPLAKKLFVCALNNNTKKAIYLLFDGVDEIDEAVIHEKLNRPKETHVGLQKFIGLIKFLKGKPNIHIALTSREHKKDFLEQALQISSRGFMILKNEDRECFLKRSWELRLTFCGIETETLNILIAKYVLDLLEDAKTIFSEQILDFIGVPLQLKMLSESFPPEPKLVDTKLTLCDYEKQVGNLTNIYRTFVSKKVSIYLMDKLQLSSDSAVKCKPFLMKSIEIHRNFAFRLLFPDKAQMCFSQKEMEKEDQHLDTAFAIGLIIYESEVDGETKYNFVHRTFAEYFVADLFANWIEHPGNIAFPQLGDLVRFLLDDDDETEVVKMFLNEMLKTLSKLDSEYFSTFMHRFSIFQYFCERMRKERQGQREVLKIQKPRGNALQKDNHFSCLEVFEEYYFNESHISLYKFLLRIVFRNVDIQEFKSLKCDDNFFLFEVLYYSIIDQFEGTYQFRKLIDCTLLPDTSTYPYPNPPVHILLTTKDQKNFEIHLTLGSELVTSIDESCFKLSQGFRDCCILTLRIGRHVIKKLTNDEKLIHSLRSQKMIEHRPQNPFQYVVYLLTCKRAAERYIAGFAMKLEQDTPTVFIFQAFSNWQILLANSYIEIPQQSIIFEEYKKRIESLNEIYHGPSVSGGRDAVPYPQLR